MRGEDFVAHSVVTNRSFALDVESAGFVIFGEDHYGLAWDPERGLRRRRVE